MSLELGWWGTHSDHLVNSKEPYSNYGFHNGFHGFCSVFVNAAFAYTGTELTGLAAAEAADPRKEIPRASKQVVWRILIFYVVNLALVGLDVPSSAKLLTGDGPESRYSPFVIAIQFAGIRVLPSIFNAVILLAVMSVANSCMFGSTRTIQALAANGPHPRLSLLVACMLTPSRRRYGPQGDGVRRQEGPSDRGDCRATSLRSSGIHQPC